MAVQQPKRPRRSGTEVRSAILDAARHLFSEKGYAGTSTREIAERAGVNEGVLFRNFGTKANMFAESVTNAFDEVSHSLYVRDLSEDIAAFGLEASLRRWVGKLYDLLYVNRDLVRAILAADAYEDNVDGGVRDIGGLWRFIATSDHRAQRFVETIPDANNHIPPIMLSRFPFGVVLSFALYGEWLLPSEHDSTDRDSLLDQLTTLILHGVTAFDAPAAP